jgi:hypothetical protein
MHDSSSRSISPQQKNKVQSNLDLHFAINISGNSPFGTPALIKNAERYECKWYPVIDLFDTFKGKLGHQKYWSQNVGQDLIVLYFFVGGISCGRKRCVREINVSRAWDLVHAGDSNEHFAINISGNSPFGTPALMKNAERYECKWYPVIALFDTFTGKLGHNNSIRDEFIACLIEIRSFPLHQRLSNSCLHNGL